MQLEQQFSQLATPKGAGRGKAFVSKLLLNIGTKAVNSYVDGMNNDPSYSYFAEKVRAAANNKKN